MVQTPSDISGTEKKKQHLNNVENMQIDNTQLQVSNDVTYMDNDISVDSSEQIQQSSANLTTNNQTQTPSIQQQKQMIKQFENISLKVGDNWYLIEQKWFDAWTTYVGYFVDKDLDLPQGPHPGPIDNSSLVLSTSSESNIYKLHPNLTERNDFTLVHENAAKLLFSWYGGGPQIIRKVVEQGNSKVIEIYPHVVEVALFSGDPKTPLQFEEMEFSKHTTIKEVRDTLKKHFNLSETEDARLWAAHAGSAYRMYEPSEEDKTIEYLITRPIGQQLILEIRGKDGQFPLDYKHKQTTRTSEFKTSNDDLITSRYRFTVGDGAGGEPGVCGLQNLGNTCFMNSALQCLTKTPFIKNYFIKGEYINDINKENPLGMRGEIANAFGELMQEMWSGKHSYISPRDFKYTIGKFAPQFSGYAQQDSQELIAYLLDGLHEDLNRVKKKPLTKPVESNGREDDIVAKESWEVHKMRNDSIIVDHFQGQLKSTLVCPNCKHISITFDPFMYLSLPLPIEKNRIIYITVFKAGNQQKAVKYAVKTPKNGTIKTLRKQLSEVTGINAEHLVIADIFQNRVYKFFSDSDLTSQIRDSDFICAYEVPGLKPDAHEKYDPNSMPFLYVRLATIEKHEIRYHGTSYTLSPIGIPFMLPYDKEKCTKKQLYDMCFDYVKRYLKDDISHIDISDKFPRPKKKQANTQEIEKTSEPAEGPYAPAAEKRADEMEEESIDVDKKMVSDDDMKENDNQFYLFTLRFNTGSHLNESDLEPVLEYSDELAETQKPEKPTSHFYYSSSEMNLLMYIPPQVLSKLVDKDKLNDFEEHESIKTTQLDTVKGVTLDDCLKLFTQVEQLGADDQWHCSKCKNWVQATKKFDLWKLPDILVIHLKRFQYNRYLREKIEIPVDIPISNFDLSPHVKGPQNQSLCYDLYAVSNHYGGLGGGHYTAYAKVNGKWYKFDDAYTCPIDESSVNTAAAYVLFYARKPQKPIEKKNNSDEKKNTVEEEDKMKD